MLYQHIFDDFSYGGENKNKQNAFKKHSGKKIKVYKVSTAYGFGERIEGEFKFRKKKIQIVLMA